GKTYNAVRRKYGDKWTLGQFLVELRSGGEEQPVTDPERDSQLEEDPTVGALLWRVNSVFSGSRIFNDFENLALDNLFRPGQCTVLQLNEIDQREQQVIVATLLRRLWRARMDTEKGLSKEGQDTYLPYPAFALIEEAHNYAPANADVVTTGILKTILSEGRKFGVAVGLISQRPGKLDSDVLSQCMTQCIMRIVNPVDQDRIAESVETVGRDLLLELPALSRGQVIIAGASVNTPVLAQVRPRLTPHGAESPDAPALWRGYFGEEQTRQRERDNAPPTEGPRRGLGPPGLPF
ncbi:MAG: ATP-binding protein, partial [Chloroflexota bacterium]